MRAALAILFNVATAVSALLSLGCVALAVDGARAERTVRWSRLDLSAPTPASRAVGVVTDSGGVRVSVDRSTADPTRPEAVARLKSYYAGQPQGWERSSDEPQGYPAESANVGGGPLRWLGVDWLSRETSFRGRTDRHRSLTLPDWLLGVPTLAMPAVWVWRRVRRRRRRSTSRAGYPVGG